ncbi:cupin domain-containing protein [Paraburkholderia sp. ZP32-5]|uniref:cupin domain-containing protein n=1 Tax=Paraburkholderia sp. ZP32-5 TaxID=2883245 RepID=UPI001F2493DD|nr:AraC family ligand binding domain-containing protein [Paraburkholderia sp. ZP32-5]
MENRIGCTHVQGDSTQGNLLSMGFDNLVKGDVREAETGGEQIVAIVEGMFDINAAGESYRLQTGEVILIPPGEPRQIICVSDTGKLYHVSTLPQRDR